MSDPSYPGLDDSWFDRGRPPPLTRAAVMAELARRDATAEPVIDVDPDDPDVLEVDADAIEAEFAESFFDR